MPSPLCLGCTKRLDLQLLFGLLCHHCAAHNHDIECYAVHTTALQIDEKNLVIFGGLDKRKRYNDIWRFNTNDKKWTCVEAEGPAPEPRAHFTATKFFDKVFVFGGYGGNGQVYADMWILHIEGPDAMRWENISESIPGKGPTPRFDHCAFIYPITPNSDTYDKLIIMGGRDLSGNHSDAYVLDLKEMAWTTETVPNLSHEVRHAAADSC